jgi:hypothetical protein
LDRRHSVVESGIKLAVCGAVVARSQRALLLGNELIGDRLLHLKLTDKMVERVIRLPALLAEEAATERVRDPGLAPLLHLS